MVPPAGSPPQAAGARVRRALVLLRHAKSAWPDDVPDHDRPLAGRGRRDAPGAGHWLAGAGRVPDLVLCSTAERARQTWRLAETGLVRAGQQVPPVTYERQIYGAAPAELLELIRQAPAGVRTLLLVGHEPAMSELALMLAAPAAGAGPPEELERMRAKFPTAAIAVLEFTGGWPGLGPGRARLARFVAPREWNGGTAPGSG